MPIILYFIICYISVVFLNNRVFLTCFFMSRLVCPFIFVSFLLSAKLCLSANDWIWLAVALLLSALLLSSIFCCARVFTLSSIHKLHCTVLYIMFIFIDWLLIYANVNCITICRIAIFMIALHLQSLSHANFNQSNTVLSLFFKIDLDVFHDFAYFDLWQ